MRKFTAVILGILMAVGFVAIVPGKASAGEAVRIIMELDTTTATALSSTPLRGRIVPLDANNELATTFNGSDITEASIEFTSEEYGDEVGFADKAATVTPAGTDYSYDSTKVTIPMGSKKWKEFAVTYANVTEVKDDTITATLVRGTKKISASRDITVKAPAANCYVVRTGGIGIEPDVLEELSTTGLADNGAKKKAGASVTVDVLAAYYQSSTGKYYFTDNVPSGAESITIYGKVANSRQTYAYQGAATLTGGRATVSAAITDLKIPAAILDSGFGSTATQQLNTLAWCNQNGITLTFSAQTKVTRQIGTASGDVDTTSKDLQVSGLTSYNPTSSIYCGDVIGSGSPSGTSLSDTAKMVPEQCQKITLVGLPVNGLFVDSSTDNRNGKTYYSGFGGVGRAFGNYYPSPADAFFLASNWKNQSTAFRTFGQTQDDNAAYFAIIGRDTHGNPAPFASKTVAFGLTETFAKNFGQTVAGWHINRKLSGDTSDSNSYVIAPGYYSFVPLEITYTGAKSTVAITEVYLSTPNTLDLAKSTALDDIKGTSTDKMMSVYISDVIRAITATQNSANAGEADNTIQIGGASSSDTYTVSGVYTYNGSAVSIGLEDATTGSSSISVKGDGEAVDFALFTANSVAGGRYLLKIADPSGATTIAAITPTISPADPGDFAPSMVVSQVNTINIGLDDEEKHDQFVLNKNYMVLDAFMNPYGTDLVLKTTGLDDADAEATVLTADKTAVFSGASAKVDGTTVTVRFNLDSITDEQKKAVLRLQAGEQYADTTINLKTPKSLKLSNIFVPVPGINDTPVAVYMADQSGSLFTPITATTALSAAGNKYTGVYEVDLEATDGLVDGVDEKTINLTTITYPSNGAVTSAPKVILPVKPDAGKTSMTIDGDSDYGKATLVLNFTPDFDAPVIGDPTAIDCGFTIQITDNGTGVDSAKTKASVVVKNASGEDITSTLSISASDTATTSTITVIGTGTGNFSITLTAYDKQGNATNATTKLVTVSTANECTVTPECLDVSPAYVTYGDPETVVTITGKNTSFGAGTTVDFSCSAVTEGAVDVESATSLTVRVTVPASGEDENCDITVTTGSETITCANKFQVLSQPPVTCVDNDGDTYGENCAAGTDCDDNDPAVNPGAAEVCDDGKDNDCDGAVDAADSDCAPACSITVSGNIRAGFILPRVFVLNITGTGTGFSTSADVTFSDTTNIRKLAQIPGAGKITVIGIVRPKAKGTTVTVSVAGCGSADVTVK